MKSAHNRNKPKKKKKKILPTNAYGDNELYPLYYISLRRRQYNTDFSANSAADWKHWQRPKVLQTGEWIIKCTRSQTHIVAWACECIIAHPYSYSCEYSASVYIRTLSIIRNLRFVGFISQPPHTFLGRNDLIKIKRKKKTFFFALGTWYR